MTTHAGSKGGRGKCTVCASPDRGAIDTALVGGTSAATIAGQFGVNDSSVKRHARNHVTRGVVNLGVDTPEISPSTSAIDVPAELRAQFQRSERAVAAAQTGGGHLSLNAALREHRQTIEAISRWNVEQAKLAAMNSRKEVVNVLTTPAWLQCRRAIMDALQPYVEARLAVAYALDHADDSDARPFEPRRDAPEPTAYKETAHAGTTTHDARTSRRAPRPVDTRPDHRPRDRGFAVDVE